MRSRKAMPALICYEYSWMTLNRFFFFLGGGGGDGGAKTLFL